MVEDRVLQVKAKAWIEVDGNDILGPGGYIILKTLKEQGSISVSYTHLTLPTN